MTVSLNGITVVAVGGARYFRPRDCISLMNLAIEMHRT